MDEHGDNAPEPDAPHSAWALAATSLPAVGDLGREALDGEMTGPGDLYGLSHVIRRHYGGALGILLVADDGHLADDLLLAAEESVLDVHVEVTSSVADTLAHVQNAVVNPRQPFNIDVVVSTLSIGDSHQLLVALRDITAAGAFPIVVLADDSRPDEERRSFALGAAGHLRIPERDYEWVGLIHTLPDFLPRIQAAAAD